jgi:AhpD family alkylhydroperoxidase
MIPNLERVMANAPALLATYSFGWEVFDETSLSPVERQIVYQTANFENECNYCVPWHTLLVKQAGADTETVYPSGGGRLARVGSERSLACSFERA